MFEGLLDHANFNNLHITSTKFDEPEYMQHVAQHESVVTIHGCSNKAANAVCLGGGNRAALMPLKQTLERNGVPCIIEGHAFQALSPMNVCNKGKLPGIQMEIPLSLRSNTNIRNVIVSATRDFLDLLARERAIPDRP